MRMQQSAGVAAGLSMLGSLVLGIANGIVFASFLAGIGSLIVCFIVCVLGIGIASQMYISRMGGMHYYLENKEFHEDDVEWCMYRYGGFAASYMICIAATIVLFILS